MASIGVCATALIMAMVPSAQAAEETVGNNLSVPTQWSEAAYPPPITMPVTEQFAGDVQSGNVVAQDEESATCDAALQQDLGNTWQADTALVEGSSVTSVNWGDNLESMDPNLSSAYTRVEMGLTQALLTPMKGYDMCWVSGRGPDEVWGAQVTGSSGSWTPTTSLRSEAVVYTAGARLTIQRIVPDRTYTWDAAAHRWQGLGADDPYFSGALHDPVADGPGSFGAEVTISGNLSYGYNWSTQSIPRGEYRLTFSLDGPTGDFAGSGTSLTNASVLTSVETEAEAKAEGSGNAAVMRGDLNLTYLDVTVGTRTDPIPVEEPVVDPTSSASATSSSTTPSVDASAGSADVGAAVEAGAGPRKQTARFKAAKKGTYRVGTRLRLAAHHVYTNAGVKLRWRVRQGDREQCHVRVRASGISVKLLEQGKCTVIAWAPSPSPEYERYRWSRTYRARW